MKKKTITILLCALALVSAFSVQAQRNCATMDHLHQQELTHPERIQRLQSIEQHTARVLQRQSRAVNGTITIPVVVHVIYNAPAENVSAAQVQSQIDVLNDDFRRLNGDASSTPAIFQGVASDVEIEFCLAATDPNGNPTDGITRTFTSTTSFPTNDNMKFSATGGTDAWPASAYLNIWVCNISGNILGYAQFPGGPAATDGVVIDYQYFGTIGTATPPFDLGRTGTHEVGHYLNLRHVWGDGGCGVDDLVADTPLAGAPNYTGAPCSFPGPNTCDEGAGDQPDMFQNYMDYSDDGCMNLFTEGQKARMRALFEPGGPRASLLNSTACNPPVPPTCDDGIQNGDETGVDCGGSNCAPCPCNDANLTLTITFDDYPEETAWEITDASAAVVASGGTYGSEPDGSTIIENITLPGGDYTFTITDAFGDGICCNFGSGSYELIDGSGAIIAAGGAFDEEESTSFCIEAPTDEVLVSPKALLMGSINLLSPGNPVLMKDDLRVAGRIPLAQPYAAIAGLNHSGAEEITDPLVLSQTGNDAIVDWVLVELRDPGSPATILATRAALLQRDGDIVDVDGASPVVFNVSPGSYQVAVRHRNHLGVMTKSPLSLSEVSVPIDFTDEGLDVYERSANVDGAERYPLGGGTAVLWGGKISSTLGQVSYIGQNNSSDGVYAAIVNDPSNPNGSQSAVVPGYLTFDLNMDGVAKYSGSANEVDLIFNAVLLNPSNGAGAATFTFREQLP